MPNHHTEKTSLAARLHRTTALAWSEPVARTYLVLVAGCALWAVAGGAGLGDAAWMPRQAVLFLTLPFFLVVHLFLVITQIDSWLLGYNFYFESPAWLFEPLYLVYAVVSSVLGARFLARWTRSSRTFGTPPWVVPLVCAAFFVVVALLWYA
ncbi:hypothetical protein ACFVP0_27115 [Streptomyces cinereoruber]|uniref:hypothetical protein n=1 Tax=Streptomyces cinereoruber TaxID=67260 RepID=UPI00367EBBFB